MAKKWNAVIWIAASVLLLTGFAGDANSAPKEKEKETIQIEGSTTVGPIAQAFVEAFERIHDNVSVTVQMTGSGDGIASLMDGKCDVANSSRFIKIEEMKKAIDKGVVPVAHVVALDGICMIVHPSNPVKNLTDTQIKKIYKGDITNWNELGGPDSQIVPITRDSSSGTFGVFSDLVMGGQKMSSGTETVAGNRQAHDRVATTKGAIGYVGIGYLDKKVKTVKVNDVTPTLRTVASGEYLISRPLYMFTNGYPRVGENIYKFITFYLSERGQEIIEAEGFVPQTNY